MSFPPEPRPSAVVILTRGEDVYLVQRPQTASFFPGFYAFPGGGVEDQDEHDTPLSTLQRCAVRETYEEIRVRLTPDQLTPAGVVTTPPFSPIRFRTQFFLATLNDDQEPDPQSPELAGGTWINPQDALDAWREEGMKLPPPVIHALEQLANHDARTLTRLGTSENTFPITFLPGLRVEPLQTQTIPPHTHTNTFIIGEGDLAVLDPGAPPPQLDPLLATLEHLHKHGHTLTHILLTHHHQDHVQGVQPLLETYDVTLAASPETARRIDAPVNTELHHEDTLHIGGHDLTALQTPGHAPGHLAYHLPQARTLLAGDLIAGIGTVLIPPDEGDMADYFESLQRAADHCQAHDTRLAFPAHGPPIFNPQPRFQKLLEHRRKREERVRNALTNEPQTIDAIADTAYEDKPEAPQPLKTMSTHAHLKKLETEQRATRQGDAWHLP